MKLSEVMSLLDGVQLEAIREAADQYAAVLELQAIRGGTHEDNLDWFTRMCQSSPFAWRDTFWIAKEELLRTHIIGYESLSDKFRKRVEG